MVAHATSHANGRMNHSSRHGTPSETKKLNQRHAGDRRKFVKPTSTQCKPRKWVQCVLDKAATGRRLEQLAPRHLCKAIGVTVVCHNPGRGWTQAPVQVAVRTPNMMSQWRIITIMAIGWWIGVACPQEQRGAVDMPQKGGGETGVK